jgi:hypothetical protein
MKNRILLFALLSIMSISFIQIVTNAQVVTDPPPEISMRAAIIGWMVKNENGILYKRQYNYSTASWIGEWVRC